MKIAKELTDKGWKVDWWRHRSRWKNFYNTIRWKIRDAWIAIKDIPEFIKTVWAYLPILWRDVDYDYSSLLRLIAFKCSRMRKHIADHGHLANCDSVCWQLRYTELLIDRILKDEYADYDRAQLDKKYGDTIMITRRVDDEGKEIHAGCSELKITREACLQDPKLMEKESEESHRIFQKAEKQKQNELDILFAHMRRHVQRWWD